jgi:hypothetical protein
MHTGISIASRLHERYELILPVRFSVLPEHADKVTYTGGADNETDADLLDIARSGAAFIASVYIPRMASILIRLYELDDAGGAPLLAGRARVQRVAMTDARPAYLIGAQFTDDSDAFATDMERLISRAETGPEHAPGGTP